MFTRSQLQTYVESISNVKDQATLIRAMLNVALERVYQHHDWPYYLDFKNGVLKTVATYSTGTIDVTNASASITSASTAFTSDMVGRKIRVQGDKPYYRITAVNAATGAGALTIDNPFQGDTATLQSYEIFKDEFRLNADVDKYKSLRQIQNGVLIVDVLPTRFDEVYTVPTAYSDPMMAMMVGNDQATYSTGTISVLATTPTIITGVGTSWTSVEGLGRCSKIRIGNNVYTIKSVDSDTQLTTYESVGTIATLTTYVIILNNIVVQLYQIPNDYSLLYYRYYRLPSPLANDYDIPDMPHDYHQLLIQGALSEVLSQKGDINKAENVYEQRFIVGLDRMKIKIGKTVPDRINMRLSADRIKRGIQRGREQPSYDYKYSS